MNYLKLLFTLIVTYETDQAIIEAGGTATTPSLQVGSIAGKPVYFSGNFSFTPTPPTA